MAQNDQFEEVDTAALEKQTQDLLKASMAGMTAEDKAMLSGSDNDHIDVTEADLEDPDLLAELGDLGYHSDEDPDNSDAKSDASGSGGDEVFEEEKNKTIQLLVQKRRAIQTKMKQFQQAMDAANAQKCQQCDTALRKIFTEISSLPAIEFVPDKEEYEAKINKIMQSFGPLSTLDPQVNITHNTKKGNQNLGQQKSKAEVQRQVAAVQKQKSQIALEVDNAIAKEEGDGAKATVKLLKERSLMYKMAAKKCLTEKNRQQAGIYLKQSKEIAKYIEPVENGIVVWMEDIPPRLESSLYMTAPNKAAQQQQQQEQQDRGRRAQQGQQGQQGGTQLSYILPNADEEATPQMLRMRMDNYRIAAFKAKQAGQIQQAKQYFAEFKTMQEQMNHMQAGKLKLTVGDLPRPLNTGGAVVSRRNVLGNSRSKSPQARDKPSTTTATKAPSAPTQPRKPVPKEAPPKALSAQDSAQYQKIIQRLERQMTVCDSDSAFLAHDPSQAEELQKWKQESHIWLTKVLECQKQKLKPPSYELVKIKFSVLKLNSDVKENEMRIIIKKFKNITLNLDGKTTCSIEFKATRDDNQIFKIKGETDSKSGKFEIEYNYSKGFTINREDNFYNHVKYGRFEIDVFTPKLFGTKHVGHATIKLKQLLQSSTIEEDVEIKDIKGGKKKIGEVELIIKLRNRVEKIDKKKSKRQNAKVAVTAQEMETVERVLMKITKFPTSNSNRNSVSKKRNSGSVGNNKQRKQQQEEKQQASQQKKRNSTSQNKKQQQRLSQSGQAQAKAKGQAAAAKSKGAANLPPGLTEEMVENPLDPMWIESFEVMEKEQEYLKKQLAAARGPAKEEINDKISSIQLNLSLIQTQVQTGLLTIDQYTAKIQNAFKRDLALRKYLLAQGRNDEAKRVGIRVLLMKKELKGSG